MKTSAPRIIDRGRRAIVGAVATMALGAAAGLAGAQPVIAPMDPTIVAAAEKEGSVTWYTNPGFRTTLKDALSEWQKRYPKIELKIVEGTGPDVMERLRAERVAGKFVADVATIGDSGMYPVATGKGLTPLDKSSLPHLPTLAPRLVEFVNLEAGYVPTVLFLYGMNVNTRRLAADEMPTKWSELNQPKYAGKLAVHDFGRIGGGNSWLTMGLDTLGQPFYASLVAQGARVYSTPQELDAAVVRGEKAIAAPSRTRVAKDYAGAPIKFIVPQDGVFFVVMQSGVVNGSTHPNAALVLLDFLLEPVTQRAIAAVGDIAVVQGVSSVVDIGTVKFLGQGAITPSTLGRQRDALEVGKTLLQR